MICKSPLGRAAACLFLIALIAPPVVSHGIVRREQSALPIASSIQVPADAEFLFIGGTMADVSDLGEPPGSTTSLGDTATQARSIMRKIDHELQSVGYVMSDIIKMEVYLVPDPDKNGKPDLLGLLAAYREYFDRQSGGLPIRTTLVVAGLPLPGALVQIAVTAARASHSGHE